MSDKPPDQGEGGAPALGELLGRGGMGEVFRAFDPALRRHVAVKVIRPEVAGDDGIRSRFVAEGQLTAQLQHPGVVPVHAAGALPDGRPYFAMKEVRGKTLEELISEVHSASPGGAWSPTPGGWTFRRLIDLFHSACEAVAYAHTRGVLHRDLKPANIMAGDYGEVLVLDWGLARVDGEVEGEISTIRSQREPGALQTRVGAITGTPAYMPPEQARGRGEPLTAAGDVYALGAILYAILKGQPPYQGRSAVAVLARVAAGPPPAPEGSGVPRDLAEICQEAMARRPGDRPADAGVLARQVAAWLEGTRQEEAARREVELAAGWAPEIEDLRAQAQEKRAAARQALAALLPSAPLAEKEPAWALEDEALALERDAALQETERIRRLYGALTRAPDLPEAHALLADHYQRRHAAAEARGDAAAAQRAEYLLRSHDRGRYADWLRGMGEVELITDPPGARVEVLRYAERARRLVAAPTGQVLHTPLQTSLPIGSYLLLVSHPGRATARVPVLVERGQAWRHVPPGETAPRPVPLLPAGEVEPEDCYVPAGWFRFGGDAAAVQGEPGRLAWCDGFVIRRFPVRVREHLACLNALAAAGREDDVLLIAPRDRLGSMGRQTLSLLGREPDGSFKLIPDAEGDLWDPEFPAMKITWDGAAAYARWLAEETGRPWRLPAEVEWEKAARGVDGRLFPWGDFLDPSFAFYRDGHAKAASMAPVEAYPLDESPYGVRGMAGNMRDWCQDVFRPVASLAAEPEISGEGAIRSVRGGSWSGGALTARLCSRGGEIHWRTQYHVGFRLVRSVSPPPP